MSLGDSYSSGEGNPPFFPNTDTPADQCHRSPVAYPDLLATYYGTDLYRYACSGATTADVINTRYQSEIPQQNHSTLGPQTALATITVGGDNANFKSVLMACIVQRLTAGLINAANPLSIFGVFNRDPSCADSAKFRNMVNSGIANAQGPVTTAYKDIRSKTQDEGSVIAAGYPQLFPTSQAAQSCIQLSPFLTEADQNFLNGAANYLDGVTHAAAVGAGVNYINPTTAFLGHGVCGANGAWINGISFASGGKCLLSAVISGCIIPGIAGTFHPNASGHKGYAGVFQGKINASTSNTPRDFPTNPAPATPPVVKPPVTAQVESVPAATDSPQTYQVGSLTLPPTSTSETCLQLLLGGLPVTVDGSGYAPNASVAIDLISPGLSQDEALLATVNANPAGTIDSTVTIPATATGFVVSGVGTGLGFIDAVGPTTSGAGLNNLNGFGLIPLAGLCGLGLTTTTTSVQPLTTSGVPASTNAQVVGKLR